MKLDLGSPASDNCYIMFKYVLDVDLSGGWDDVPEYASTFLDDVVLPPFYGRTSVPGAATTPSPEMEQPMYLTKILYCHGTEYSLLRAIRYMLELLPQIFRSCRVQR